MLLSHRRRPRVADSDHQRRLQPAKPGASNTRSLWRSHPGRPKPAPRWSLNRPPVPNRQIRSSSGGKFPIDRHQPRCELSPRFPPSRLFGRLPVCAARAAPSSSVSSSCIVGGSCRQVGARSTIITAASAAMIAAPRSIRTSLAMSGGIAPGCPKMVDRLLRHLRYLAGAALGSDVDFRARSASA